MQRLTIALALALAAGCAHKETTREAANPTTPPTAAPPNTAKQARCDRDSDCGPGQLCIRNACVDISGGLTECGHVRVHFALNASELDNEDRNQLERSARCLKADHALHVAIEGNADERGTEEYNLALGDRRATVVAKYMEALGVSQGQLKTVSYGKENPLCTEHDEDCWAKNRRAELNAAKATGKPKRR